MVTDTCRHCQRPIMLVTVDLAPYQTLGGQTEVSYWVHDPEGYVVCRYDQATNTADTAAPSTEPE